MHEFFFQAALDEARRAALNNEVPIGAVLEKGGEIIARAANATEREGNFLAHAELHCILEATKILKTKYLVGCTLYVTLEPCMMCQTAARLSRISAVHYLVASEKFGSAGQALFQTKVEKIEDPLSVRSAELLRRFFSERR